jgi:hypothetical protein
VRRRIAIANQGIETLAEQLAIPNQYSADRHLTNTFGLSGKDKRALHPFNV